MQAIECRYLCIMLHSSRKSLPTRSRRRRGMSACGDKADMLFWGLNQGLSIPSALNKASFGLPSGIMANFTWTSRIPIRRNLHDTGKSLFVWDCVVGLGGLEPPTKRLSAATLSVVSVQGICGGPVAQMHFAGRPSIWYWRACSAGKSIPFPR
jgi:hypothetical protein